MHQDQGPVSVTLNPWLWNHGSDPETLMKILFIIAKFVFWSDKAVFSQNMIAGNILTCQ